VGKKKKSGDEFKLNPDGWMGTMSDLVFLLITFFVLLISMSSMDAKKLKEAFGFFDDAVSVLSFQEDTTGIASFVDVLNPLASFLVSKERAHAGANLRTGRGNSRKLFEKIADGLSGAVPSEGLIGTLRALAAETDKELGIERVDEGYAVELPGRLLYPEGRIELDDEARGLLAALAQVLRLWGGQIEMIESWTWHEGPMGLGQVRDALEKSWLPGGLIHPVLNPMA